MEPKDLGELISLISTLLIILDQVVLLYLWPRWRNLFSRQCSLGRVELRRTVTVSVIYLSVTAVVMILMMAGFFVR